jgi:hypothetical protein
MPHIGTLVEDINSLVSAGFESSDEWASALGKAIATEVSLKFQERQKHYLRPSNLGDKCDRKLWLGVHSPELEEPLPPDAKIKFLYGDILEELVLSLAIQAGHKVEGQQSEVHNFGLVGHIDAIIDGTLVDVKSASSIAFEKFREHLSPGKDSFGYLYQIGFYLEASQSNPALTNPNEAAFLVIDKTLGKLHLDRHPRPELKRDWGKHADHKRAMLESKKMPERGYLPEADGKSGNLKLGVSCSYCSFKHACWPGLRTFLYSNGPRYLTHVARTPDVQEAGKANPKSRIPIPEDPVTEGQGSLG